MASRNFLFLKSVLVVGTVSGALSFCTSREAGKLGLTEPKTESTRSTTEDTGAAKSQPQLVVLLVVDQMRSDYIDRFKPLLEQTPAGKGGLLWLRNSGVWFSNARTASAPTVTAAGHASLCTGSAPMHHQIGSNDFFDRNRGRNTALATDSKATLVRTPELLAGDPLSQAPEEGSSPARLQAKTLGELVKEQFGQEAKSLAVSIKDRSALFCGGRVNDGAYFFDSKSGSMVTSSFYNKSALPEWVNTFNRDFRVRVDRADLSAFDWKLLLGEASQYERVLRPVDVRKTAEIVGKAPLKLDAPGSFPRYLIPRNAVAGKVSNIEKFERFIFLPAASDLLVDFASKALEGEILPSLLRERPDGSAAKTSTSVPHVPHVMIISFSTPDIVGHFYGQSSLELTDTYLRLHQSIERLRQNFETKLGAQNILWALSADHGIMQIPELIGVGEQDAPNSKSAAGGAPQRMSGEALVQKIASELESMPAYGPGKWILGMATDQLYLNLDLVAQKGMKPGAVEEMVAKIAAKQPGIEGALTRTELEAAQKSLKKSVWNETTLNLKESYGKNLRKNFLARGFAPATSGDVFLVVREGFQISDGKVTANHGTVWDGDAHIPLAIVGAGVPAGVEVKTPVFADDVVPTIFELLGRKVQGENLGNSRVAEFVR